MKRNLTFFRVEFNGTKFYATCCEHGPFTNPEQAMAKAEEYNRNAAKAQKKQNERVVLEWRERKTQ